MRIDSHQHFWKYNPSEQVWMTDAMEVLKRDYLPGELEPLLRSNGFDGTIAVQARQIIEETSWLLELADNYPMIKGVVGWVDLQSPELRSQLELFSSNPKLVGVRHVVHDEPDDNFMLRPQFLQGIAQLSDFGLTYDLLLFPKHLRLAVKLVEMFPQQAFVLDHIGKPAIRDGVLSPWCEDLRCLAEFPNVSCKLSGLVTEARWGKWRPAEFHRYLDIVIESFGTDRVMIGSDWPVCTLSGDYASSMLVVMEHVLQFPENIREQILGGNCSQFYGLKI